MTNNQIGKQAAFQTINIRGILLGMLAINVLNGIILLVSMCLLPLVFIFSQAAFDKSIGQITTLLILALIVTCSIEFNLIQIGLWCIRRLFSTINDRIAASTLLLAWHILLIAAMFESYFDTLLVLVVLGLAISDKLSENKRKNSSA